MGNVRDVVARGMKATWESEPTAPTPMSPFLTFPFFALPLLPFASSLAKRLRHYALDLLRHFHVSDRAGVRAEPDLTRRPVERHVADRVPLGAVAQDREVGYELLRLRVEDDHLVRLHAGFHEPDAILVVLRVSVRLGRGAGGQR